MLNNERCFLETEPWKKVFRSVIVPRSLISDRSEIVISLMIRKIEVTSLFAQVSNVVCHETDYNMLGVRKLKPRIHQVRTDLLIWHCEYQSLLGLLPGISPGTAQYDRWCKVFGIYLSLSLLANRLLAAISASERPQAECEAQTLAGQAIILNEEARVTNPLASLLIAQTVGLAQATKATAHEWQETHGTEKVERVSSRRLIEKWKFERWCKLLGRRI